MAQQITLSNEQFQQLIETVRVAAINSVATAKDADGNAVVSSNKTKGSFSNCDHRFGGVREHETVEEFITSIETYKDIEEISDEDALKGVSLLFYGFASTWWQGVRKEAKTWQDVPALIREHFSPTKPAYQVYMEIFAEKQSDETPIDTFVCQKRALLAQLPDGRHDEEAELDLVYGLLNIKYRKHIARHDIKSFRELLEQGRIIEHNNKEYEETNADNKAGPVRGAKGTKRCTYCNFRGHTFSDCRKRKQAGDHAEDNH